MRPLSLLTLILCFVSTGCCAPIQTSTSLMPTNGTDGWKTVKGGDWVLKDGILSGSKDAALKYHCLLVTEKSYGDFTAEIEYKAAKDNSGFYLRLQPADNKVGFSGYHIELDSKGNNEGGIFDVAVAWLVKPDKALIQKAFKPGDWNAMTITAIGPVIRVTLNGIDMCSIKNARASPGKFGIQLHAGENTQIQFRKIQITER